jgi:opacity protein-like surface antigen
MMRCVRLVTCFVIVTLVGVSRLQAQSASEPRWYAEATAAATLGHKSDSSFGGEAGGRFSDLLDAFIEFGHMGNVGNSDLEARAQKIADFLQGTVATSAYKMNYFDIGLKYRVMETGRWHPYVGLGLGFAHITPEVRFAVNGTDVTDQLPALGVQLGADLSESHNTFLFVIGLGTMVNFGSRYFADLTYRYGHTGEVSDSDETLVKGLNTQRVQAGVGIRF